MIRKGDVFWFGADPILGSEQGGRRPAVVVSRNTINDFSPVIVIVPITTYRGQRLYPSDVLLVSPDGGLKSDSVALGLQIRAVDKSRLGGRIGALNDSSIKNLEAALLKVLDIQ